METNPITLVLVLPLLRTQQVQALWADVARVTDRASSRAGRTRDVTAGVTELINSWGWREALWECHFQPPSPGKAALSSEL